MRGWEAQNGRKVGRRDGEWWGISPPISRPATWVFPCFNKAVFKDTSPPEGRVTPAGEERGPALTAAPPAVEQTRQVSSRAPLLSSLKQNKRPLFARPGCALMERILFSQQRGLRHEDCGKCVFQKQEIRYVSSDLERASQFQVGCLRRHTCGHRVALVKFDICVTLLPDRRSHGNTAKTTVPNCGALRLLRARLESSKIYPTLFQSTDMTHCLTEHSCTADSWELG